jgi:hypothetical protein
MSSLDTNFSNTIIYGSVNSLVNVTSAGTEVITQDAGTTTIVNFSYDSTTVTQSVNNSKTTILDDQNASIIGLALAPPQYPFGDPYFENVVLMSYLSNIKSSATLTPLNNLDTYKYEGDFYGILNDIGVPLAYHPITLKLNGFTDTGLYNTSITSILVPNFTLLNQIASTYANTVGNPYS